MSEYQSELNNAPEESDDKEVKTKAYWQSQLDWLNKRFPDGTYRDVIGLCKAAKVGVSYELDENNEPKLDKKGNPIEIIEEDSIADQDYSLNAGRMLVL